MHPAQGQPLGAAAPEAKEEASPGPARQAMRSPGTSCAPAAGRSRTGIGTSERAATASSNPPAGAHPGAICRLGRTETLVAMATTMEELGVGWIGAPEEPSSKQTTA